MFLGERRGAAVRRASRDTFSGAVETDKRGRCQRVDGLRFELFEKDGRRAFSERTSRTWGSSRDFAAALPTLPPMVRMPLHDGHGAV